MKLLVLSFAVISLASGVLSQAGNPCQSLPDGTGFVNDESACDRYISCINFLPFLVTCPSPFYFDAIRLVCDLPQNVQCNLCPSTGIVSLPNQDSCSKWTLCVNGRELQQECAAGTWFDRKLGTCDLSENVFCETDTCGNLAGGVGLAPSPNECDSYFYCYNGTKLSKGRCRPGLAFDNLTKRCVRAENVDCFPGARLLPANLPVAPTSLSSRG